MQLEPKYDLSLQKEATCNLIRRLLPRHHQFFRLEEFGNVHSQEAFEISSSDHQIILKGTGGVAWASALNWYLKYYCNVQFSWFNTAMRLPDKLPPVSEKIYRESPHAFRYYLNYCTFSYSMAWWNWSRWEQEIDWMALNGINMPLAVMGHEAIWQKLLLDFGFSNQEVYDFFSGPAYRAWGWMGNIENWGGPLPQSWIDDQMKLQKLILQRERELGMTPVLHSFSGHVPQKFKDLFPNARISQLPGWYGYPGNHFLDPTDPLFKELCSKYMKHQRELYDTDHFYTTDLFHEIDLPDNQKDKLNRISNALLSNMMENDPDAVWVMQSWSLRENILKSLHADHVLVLDLYCDSDPKWQKTEAFYSKPWIWCMLHNFGGRTGLSGKMELIASEPARVLKDPDRGHYSGIGIAPEGIENNPVIYDLMAEMAWRDEPVDLDTWLRSYTRRRYGIDSSSLNKAWSIMRRTVYTGPDSFGPLESEICARPSLDIRKVSSNGSTILYYDPAELVQAWPYFLEDHDVLQNSHTYRYDLVDLTRQILTDFGRKLYRQMIRAVEASDAASFETVGQKFLDLILDIDEILATQEPFLFGKWVNDARKKGMDPKEMKLMEWNASTQVTLWSSPEITEFHDYANKQWAGLLEGYYHKRWEMFIEAMLFSLSAGKTFNEKRFQKQIIEWEVRWPFFEHNYPSKPIGDSIEKTMKMYEKYREIILDPGDPEKKYAIPDVVEIKNLK